MHITITRIQMCLLKMSMMRVSEEMVIKYMRNPMKKQRYSIILRVLCSSAKKSLFRNRLILQYILIVKLIIPIRPIKSPNLQASIISLFSEHLSKSRFKIFDYRY